MEGFDREALVAKAGKSHGNSWFWVAIGALPVIGIAAGLVLGFGGQGGHQPVHGIDLHPGTLMLAEAEAVEAAPAAPAAAVFSAKAEIEKYQTTLGTLAQCAGGYGSSDEHMAQAMATYRKANEAKVLKLNQLASAERVREAEERLERLAGNEVELWAGAMTGQLQRDVANEMTAMAAEFDRYDRMRDGYLGADPSNPDCIRFRNEVIMGKHNVTLG